MHERPWKNFGHNRNQALELAKGKADYILFMDADELLEYTPGFKMPPLILDAYDSIINETGTAYTRKLLIKDGLDWKWHGVLHEYVASPRAKSSDMIKGIKKISKREGARSADPLKYQKDAKVLEEALKEDPTNKRHVFYLAQSYRDAGDSESAIKNYEKRATMGGWDQEVFYSKLQIAKLQEKLKMDPHIIEKSYLAAYQYRPIRAEPLCYLARFYRLQNDYEKAYQIAKKGLSIKQPGDNLFVDSSVYQYSLLFECSISSYYVGEYEESQKLCKQLLAMPNLPQNYRESVEGNIVFANTKLDEKAAVEAQ